MASQANLSQPNDSLWIALGWEPSTLQLEQFILLQNLLKEMNSKVNLTRLVEKEDYWIGQVFDSLWPLKKELIKPEKVFECIDVGTGCGFPGLALAIALPHIQLTLVDAVQKKTSALKNITTALGFDKRVNVLNQRIEITGQSLSLIHI